MSHWLCKRLFTFPAVVDADSLAGCSWLISSSTHKPISTTSSPHPNIQFLLLSENNRQAFDLGGKVAQK